MKPVFPFSNAKQCPRCGDDTIVYDVRTQNELLRRFRRCKACYETYDTVEVMVEELRNELENRNHESKR